MLKLDHVPKIWGKNKRYSYLLSSPWKRCSHPPPPKKKKAGPVPPTKQVFETTIGKTHFILHFCWGLPVEPITNILKVC